MDPNLAQNDNLVVIPAAKHAWKNLWFIVIGVKTPPNLAPLESTGHAHAPASLRSHGLPIAWQGDFSVQSITNGIAGYFDEKISAKNVCLQLGVVLSILSGTNPTRVRGYIPALPNPPNKAGNAALPTTRDLVSLIFPESV